MLVAGSLWLRRWRWRWRWEEQHRDQTAFASGVQEEEQDRTATTSAAVAVVMATATATTATASWVRVACVHATATDRQHGLHEPSRVRDAALLQRREGEVQHGLRDVGQDQRRVRVRNVVTRREVLRRVYRV